MNRKRPIDPDYIIQGCYSDGRVCESTGSDNEAEAVKLALDMIESFCFEGDYVVVMSRDGELVYDSRIEANVGCPPGCLCVDLEN